MYLCRLYTDLWLMSKSSQSGTMMAPVPTKHQEQIVKWFYSNHFSDSLPCVFGIHIGRDIPRITNVMRFLPWSFTALHRSDDYPKQCLLGWWLYSPQAIYKDPFRRGHNILVCLGHCSHKSCFWAWGNFALQVCSRALWCVCWGLGWNSLLLGHGVV